MLGLSIILAWLPQIVDFLVILCSVGGADNTGFRWFIAMLGLWF